MKRITTILALGLAFLGFLDASYLTIVHYKHIVPPCSIAHGCETVLNSQFSMIGPIPISLVGALFYVTFMGLLGLYFETKKKLFLNAALLLSASSIVVSIYLVYLQAFVLHAFCQYCLTSEGINVLLFASVLWLWKKK